MVLGAEPPPFIEEISSVCVTLILSRVESRRQSSDSIRIRIHNPSSANAPCDIDTDILFALRSPKALTTFSYT